MTDTDDLVVQRWTYMHRCILNGKIAHRWQRSEGQPAATFSGAPKHPVIGGLYEVEASVDGDSARVNSARFAERALHDADVELAAWRLEDRAAATADEQRKLIDKLRKNDTDIGDLTLAEVRTMLVKGVGHRSAATLAVVLRYLGAA